MQILVGIEAQNYWMVLVNVKLLVALFTAGHTALDGNLKYAKTMSENPNFDFSEHSLIEYNLKEIQGFLFAFLGNQPTDLEYSTW